MAEHGDSDQRLTITTSTNDGRQVEIAVADTGPGVAPQMREKIFEQFFSTKPDGLGMGLAISRSIVRNHGGELTVESSEAGSTFRFRLPAAGSGVPAPSGIVDDGRRPTPHVFDPD
jgi:signal transduction histidine kinase